MNLAYLTRGDFTGDVFASITARGPNRNVVRNEITVDLPQGQALSRSKTVFLEPGEAYGVDYLYDWPAGTFTLTVSDALGPIKFISGPVTARCGPGTRPGPSSSPRRRGKAMRRNLGWTYSDLVIEWRP